MGKNAINVSTKVKFLTFSPPAQNGSGMIISDKCDPHLPLEKTPKDFSKLDCCRGGTLVRVVLLLKVRLLKSKIVSNESTLRKFITQDLRFFMAITSILIKIMFSNI